MFLSLTELKIPDYFALKFHSQEMKWNQRDRGKKQHIFIYNDKNNNVEIYHKKIGRKNFMECDDSFRKKWEKNYYLNVALKVFGKNFFHFPQNLYIFVLFSFCFSFSH